MSDSLFQYWRGIHQKEWKKKKVSSKLVSWNSLQNRKKKIVHMSLLPKDRFHNWLPNAKTSWILFAKRNVKKDNYHSQGDRGNVRLITWWWHIGFIRKFIYLFAHQKRLFSWQIGFLCTFKTWANPLMRSKRGISIKATFCNK